MIHKPLPAVALALTIALLSGCGGGTSGKTTPVPSATVKPATPTPIPTPPPLSAPAVVQIENSEFGRPQSGLGSADVVYEYVAEGGIGRFSLMFFHLPPSGQQVGPVRSARTVTVQLAQLYHAYLVYSGAGEYVNSLIAGGGFPAFNETSAQGNLFRVDFRSAPHNLYTDGKHLGNLAARAALPPAAYKLWPRTAKTAASAVPATSFSADISESEQPVFNWDAAAHGYTRTESTGLVKDGQTGAVLHLPTVIVQQVSVTTDTRVVDVNGVYGVDQAIKGSGPAQVFTGGYAYNATWSQGDSGPPQFTLANGSPAPIAPGEVWICLVPTGQPAAIQAPASPKA